MADNSRKPRSLVRFRTLTLILGAVSVLMVVKMLIVMFAERQYWHDVSDLLADRGITVPAQRGNILSDEGLLMASSMPQYRIFLDFRSSEKAESRAFIKDQANKDSLYFRGLDEVCEVLSGLFPKYTAQDLKAYYGRGYSQKTHYFALLPDAKPLSYNQYLAAKETMWLSPNREHWFYSMDRQIARKKPFGTLATRTLGDLYGAKDSARYGLELSFDSLLRGAPGIGHEELFRNKSRIVIDQPQVDGCDVITTINVEMQDVAEQALRRELELVDAVSGVAVVMEVKTGDVKAIASLTRAGDGHYYEMQNNVVKELFEPGSTFKTVSMMVALDAGKFTLEDSVDCGMGPYLGFGARMTDSHYIGWQKVPDVLAQSSNIGTAKLISKAYKGHEQEYVEGIYKTGINTHFTMQLSGTAAPVIRKDGYWDATRLPWMAYGYNVQLPVINTLAFYNGIANGGCMVEPRLVTAVVKDGKPVMTIPVKVVREQMCKPETLADIKYMLEKVVIDGTGKRYVSSKYFPIAGKTGTAQMSEGKGYRDGGVRYLASFCGYFPADDPQYTCITTVRTSTSYGAGASLGGPIFKEIAEKIMASQGRRDLELAVDSTLAKMPRVLSGDLAKADAVLTSLGLPFTSEDIEADAWGSVTVENDSISFTSRNYAENLVPNVVGMGAQDAVWMLESRGLRVSIEGYGRVYSQSLQAGSTFNQGNRITIKLRM